VISALLALVLSQPVAPVAPAPTLPEAPAGWPTVVTWSDGGRERTAHLDESLVAERGGDEHTGAALRSQGAMVSSTRGKMRLWRVERAQVVLVAEPKLLPVYRDEGSPKLRVPIGGVLVVPAKSTTATKLREVVGGKVVASGGVVRVPCPPAKVFELTRTLSGAAGVAWAQPDWWLGAQGK